MIFTLPLLRRGKCPKGVWGRPQISRVMKVELGSGL